MTFDPVSEEYLSVAFGIERRFPGFIDAYFGPAELKARADAQPDATAIELLRRLEQLGEAVRTGDYPESRQTFLHAQITAMTTICRRLAGEPIAYVDEVRACFDIEPAFIEEGGFDQAIDELDDALPGKGDVRERMIAWRAGYAITPEVARALVPIINAEARSRTQLIVGLPSDEQVDFVFVDDKPWSGYNWYLGNFRSRVELNTDLPMHAHELTDLICHEAYPGHHTEHALKDLVLYQEHGYGEHAIQLINTPECVISEGIATLAQSIIFPDGDGAEWQSETLYPLAGIGGNPDQERSIAKAKAQLRGVGGNAALLLHAEGKHEDEVVAYLTRFGLSSEREAWQRLRFIADPLWRPYIFTYHLGRDLLRDWLDQSIGTERVARFCHLLTDQTTPSAIAVETASYSA